jgi:choline dehydrogenase-like flavoprotein
VLPYEKRNPYPMGSVTHEAGGARMGDDPQKSVLDGWNRCHDIKNLLVVDAAAFVSHPEKSITLTIMALAMRASEHLRKKCGLALSFYWLNFYWLNSCRRSSRHCI